MRESAKGLLASLILHLIVGLAALGAIAAGSRNAPLPVVDLTLLPPPEGQEPHADLRNRTAGHPPARAHRTAPRPAAPLHPALPSSPEPAPVNSFRTEAAAVERLPARSSAQSAGFPAAVPAGKPSGSAPATSAAVGKAPATAGDAGPAQGAEGTAENAGRPRGKGSGKSPERAYGYIRETIQRGIAYPPVARRMGWEGKVVVAFVILPDGSVRNVRVLQGSGFAVLDRNAVDAVRTASPYPRPPSEAEIITPVVYRLD